MSGAMRVQWLLAFLAAFLPFFFGSAPALQAQSAQERYYEAYFLEMEKGDVAAALELYESIAGDSRADADLREKARARMAACREDIRTTDFADLMPPKAMAYIEINRPGDQLQELLDQLGLLRAADEALAEGGRQLAISPALVQQILGVRGAALAITGFNPQREEPTGVLVLHPGKVEVIRGFIETALPASAAAVTTIEGHATYDIEGEVFVTLTSKLVIASRDKSQIEGVLRRLSGSETSSLATDADMREVLGTRRDDLLFFCANARPIMPMVSGLIQQAAAHDPEVAMAQAVLDLESLETLTGRAGVSKAGVSFELALNLAEGHQNLVFNLLRLPGIERESLRAIPRGAAGFVAAALNERRQTGPRTGNTDGIVTGMDIGREIFGNIINVSVFALPPGGSGGGSPIPDAAAIFTVNDPSKTESLWNLALGLGHMASGRGALEGDSVSIEGTTARSFRIENGPVIYTASVGDQFIIATSQQAMGRSLQTRSGGSSILDDPAYAKNLSTLDEHSTTAIFVHPGRIGQIAQGFAPPREFEQIAPFIERMTETLASVVITHSGETLKVSSMVTGVPEIGDLFSQAWNQRNHRAQVAAAEVQAERAHLRAVEARTGDLEHRFAELASRGEIEAATKIGASLAKQVGDDATWLNNFAWKLLTEDPYEGSFAELAWNLSDRSNHLTRFENWMYVDTLALAEFQKGNAARAVELQEKALELAGDSDRSSEVARSLERYREALGEMQAYR